MGSCRMRASSAASDISCPMRSASRSSFWRGSGVTLMVTMEMRMPASTMTTSISIKVKPAAGERRAAGTTRAGVVVIGNRSGCGRTGAATGAQAGELQRPGPDVGVGVLAAGLAVGAETEDVDFAPQARVQVLIGVAPGIFGYRTALQVAALFPVHRYRFGRRFGDQRLQALFRRRIAPVVEPVELERLHDRGNVLPRRGDTGVIGAADDPWDDQRGQDPENRDHDHDFDQRESAIERKTLGLHRTHMTTARGERKLEVARRRP